MRYNEKDKLIELSVREIAFSLDKTYGEKYISRRLRAKIGQDAHTYYQSNSEGHTEYYIQFIHEISGWKAHIRGRADIVHKKENSIHIEEIKSTVSDIENVTQDITQIMQLQIYCHYFHFYEGYNNITASLIYIDPVNNKEKHIDITPNPISNILDEIISGIISQIETELLKKSLNKKRSNTIKFPYKKYHKYQKEIIENIDKNLENSLITMLNAPPGIGKTMASLYPSLKYIISQNKRLFITTSKTTQQEIYLESFKNLLKEGSKFKSIRITSKQKICKTDTYDCDENDCPLFEKYFNIENNSLPQQLLKLDLIDRNLIEELSNDHSICPFELSLDTALECDIILSDYNYIFHPRIKFQRFLDTFNNSILIIDEAHNLIDRASSYYSESISASQIREINNFVKHSSINEEIKLKISTHLKRLINHISRLKDQVRDLEFDNEIINIDIQFFDNFQKTFDNLLIEYINDLPFKLNKKDAIIKFSDHLKFFTLLLNETNTDEFETVLDIQTNNLRILCKSASKKLTEQINKFDSVILQSATLTPTKYYQSMLGLPKNVSILSYPSPFPPENSLYLIDNSISTTYKERKMFISNIIKLIKDVIELKQGNYLIFFPSFEFLDVFKPHLIGSSISFNILSQDRNMTDKSRAKILSKLKNNTSQILLAVMGGIFSEGVDFKGDMANGAFIIGPGLPKISFDQELKKSYFEKYYGNGFDYAYKFPGLTKVIQSAGRVFRSNTDRGFVIFMGHRFSTDSYLNYLPTDYDIKFKNIITEINRFWSHN